MRARAHHLTTDITQIVKWRRKDSYVRDRYNSSRNDIASFVDDITGVVNTTLQYAARGVVDLCGCLVKHELSVFDDLASVVHYLACCIECASSSSSSTTKKTTKKTAENVARLMMRWLSTTGLLVIVAVVAVVALIPIGAIGAVVTAGAGLTIRARLAIRAGLTIGAILAVRAILPVGAGSTSSTRLTTAGLRPGYTTCLSGRRLLGTGVRL